MKKLNDSELLLWIAGHMSKFELGFGHAQMDYIDDEGNHRVACFQSEESAADLDMLKGCINVAVNEIAKNETTRK